MPTRFRRSSRSTSDNGSCTRTSVSDGRLGPRMNARRVASGAFEIGDDPEGPTGVATARSTTRLIRLSVRLRKVIRSAMVPSFRPCARANSTRSGSRAMVPSSFMISHSTAAGFRPASPARSQHASVCPARASTPPGCATSGKTWPGWTISSARAAGAAATRIVCARSAAEMPVVTPLAARSTR